MILDHDQLLFNPKFLPNLVDHAVMAINIIIPLKEIISAFAAPAVAGRVMPASILSSSSIYDYIKKECLRSFNIR